MKIFSPYTLKLGTLTALALLNLTSCGREDVEEEVEFRIVNPGFEQGMEGWRTSDDTTGQAFVIQEAAHSGAYGLRMIDEEDDGRVEVRTLRRLPADPDTEYELSFHARMLEGSGIHVTMRFHDAEGNRINQELYDPDHTWMQLFEPEATDWQSYTFQTTSPPGTAEMLVMIRSNDGSIVSPDFDDFELRRLE